MIGYYRLTDEEIKELPSGSRNIENDIYNLVYPLIIGDELPKDLYLLYTTLEIPIIKFKDIIIFIFYFLNYIYLIHIYLLYI